MSSNISTFGNTVILTLNTISSLPKVVTLPLISQNQNRVLFIKDAFGSAYTSSIGISTSSTNRIEYPLSFSTTRFNYGNTSVMLLGNPTTNRYQFLNYYLSGNTLAFDPIIDTFGLVAWWDFTDQSQMITYTGGNPSALRVSRVNDKTGNNYFLSTYSQTNNFQGPIISSLGVFFDNGNVNLVNISTKGLRTFGPLTLNRMPISTVSTSVFFVASCTGPGTFFSPDLSTMFLMRGDATTAVTSYSWNVSDKFFVWNRATTQIINFPNYFSSTKRLFSITSSRGITNCFIDGLFYSTNTSGIAGTLSGIQSNIISIGGHGTTNASYTGLVGEILIYDNIAEENDRLKIEGYLATKHNIQANLPLIHPYRFISVD